jgi:hypothetical protein
MLVQIIIAVLLAVTAPTSSGGAAPGETTATMTFTTLRFAENPEPANYKLLNGVNLVVPLRTQLALEKAYTRSGAKEYSVCVGVDKKIVVNGEESIVTVTLTTLSNYRLGGERWAYGLQCRGAYLHSHVTHCQDTIWMGDVDSAAYHFRRGNDLWIVQCASNALEVYTRDNLWEGVVVEW